MSYAVIKNFRRKTKLDIPDCDINEYLNDRLNTENKLNKEEQIDDYEIKS